MTWTVSRNWVQRSILWNHLFQRTLPTSPAVVPAPAIVTVTATSVAEPANYASATVSLKDL